MSDVRMYPRHVREVRICLKGARRWSASQGYSWSDFVKHGIPVSELEHIDNAFLQRAIAAARKEHEES